MKEKVQKTLTCCVCEKEFNVSNRQFVVKKSRLKTQNQNIYCSRHCSNEGSGRKPRVFVNCSSCGMSFDKLQSQIKKTKNNFCSQSCAGTYSNANRTHGYRRSKLEVWLELELASLFPDLEFLFNKKETIQSELDIYIPELKLAFELNGIFHYEPIYGEDKLSKIQSNDNRKFQACLEKGIELCIIDTSGQKYFKPASSQKYLDIICQIIKIKYAVSDSN